jgi:hypothetical protein
MALCKELDASGIMIWEKKMVSVAAYSNISGTSIMVDALGNISTTGSFYGTCDFEPSSNTNRVTHVFANVLGCDSIVTLDLTILNTSAMDVQIGGDNYTWINGLTHSYSNNSPTHTLTNSAGCDSVVLFDLTILNSAPTDVIVSCDSYTWIDGVTYAANKNTAIHTLTNAAGCDSLVTLNLLINSLSTGIDLIKTCDSVTWIDGNTYTTKSNTATPSWARVHICPSRIILS